MTDKDPGAPRRPHMPHATFIRCVEELGVTHEDLKTMTASPNQRIRAWLKGEDQIPFAFFGWFRAFTSPGAKDQILDAFRQAIKTEGKSDPTGRAPQLRSDPSELKREA